MLAIQKDNTMKKRPRVYYKEFSTARSRAPQKRSHSSIRWLFITACCSIAFVCMLGIANAASSGSGGASTLAQKMQGPQQLLKDGRAHPHAKPTNQNQAPAVQPAPARQEGIADLGQGPFPHSAFAVDNFWQGPVDSDWVLAYAGAKSNADGTAGVGGIVLYTETVNNLGGFDLHPLGTFLAPNGTSALTITARQGNLLLLHSKVGQQLAFNLVSHQFQ
jgi:hypothetical protein